MQVKWNDGVYTGEMQNGKPNGRGVLQLQNGYKKGVWAEGVLRQGIEYVGDVLYVGDYDEQGRYHGKGYHEKENVFVWQGEWEHGKIVKDDNSSLLPNCVFVGMYYGGIEPRYLHEGQFPQNGKVGRSGYYGMRVPAERYEMPLLSNAFGFQVVCAVEKPNNRWDYSKGYNRRALFFCDKNCPNMFDDAWVVKWVDGEYAPLTPQEAFDINDFIHQTLAYENIEDFGKEKQKFAERKFVLLDCGIYKGDLDVNGNPTGYGWIVYDHDDKQGRVLYKGKVLNGVPNGYGELFYRSDAENRHYKGNFKNGLFHTVGSGGYAKASLEKRSGADWYGVWVDGEFEGDDNAIAIGGWAYERYDGKFVKSQLVKGSHVDPRDTRGKYRYEGEFLNFLPHGYGTETIGEQSWTGYFANGKRLVGVGANSDKNALELFDPYVARSINVEEFCNQAFGAQMVTNENNLKFVTNDKILSLGKKVGTKLVLVCSADKDNAQNSLAKLLFDVDAWGSCIICQNDGQPKAVSPAQLNKLYNILQEQLALLQEKAITCYNIVTLEEKHSSDWNVTRETHDDYPLEADHDFFGSYFYLMTIGQEKYYVIYHTLDSYEWEASNQDHEEFCFAEASVKAHKIPRHIVDHEQIKDYCNSQNKWTAEVKHKVNGEYGDLKKQGGFFPLLISKLFGVKFSNS